MDPPRKRLLRNFLLLALWGGLAVSVAAIAGGPAPLRAAASETGEDETLFEESTEEQDPEGSGERSLETGKVPEGAGERYSIRNAPAFEVPPRKEDLDMYPCSDCHEGQAPNPEERVLEEEHEDIVLTHGGDRFWCNTCHNIKNPDTLISLKEKPIDLDKAYVLCGECHFQRQRDWYFGAHGKRIRFWRGTREIYSCPECHEPHSPRIKPFKPVEPPRPRTGLADNLIPAIEHPKMWETLEGREE